MRRIDHFRGGGRVAIGALACAPRAARRYRDGRPLARGIPAGPQSNQSLPGDGAAAMAEWPGAARRVRAAISSSRRSVFHPDGIRLGAPCLRFPHFPSRQMFPFGSKLLHAAGFHILPPDWFYSPPAGACAPCVAADNDLRAGAGVRHGAIGLDPAAAKKAPRKRARNGSRISGPGEPPRVGQALVAHGLREQ